MRPNIMIKTTLFLFLITISLAGISFADASSEYADALAKGRSLAKSVQSYEILSSLVMENNVQGQGEGMKLEATQTARGQMPDRLFVSIESPMFQQQMGTGATESWFSLPAAGVCYLGKPVKLSRTLEDDGKMELTNEKIFNFYAGISDFLFTEDRNVVGEINDEVLQVNGQEIKCRVFNFKTDDGTSQFWYDDKSGLIMKARLVTTIVDQGMEVERVLVTQVNSFSLNVELEDEKFAFETPAGLRVVNSLERVMNPDSMVGLPAPDISFTGLDGEVIHLKDNRGKVVFIDFWATWCGPCRKEMPHIEKLYQEMQGNDGIVFFGASNEEKSTVTKYLSKNEYSFPIVLVAAADARNLFKVSSIPAGFVIDAEGIIRAHMIGTQSEGQLRAAFAKGGFGQ